MSKQDLGNGAVIPPHLAPGRLIHSSADNIDINDGTLDGKHTLHVKQYATLQRGPSHVVTLESMTPAKHATLAVPGVMNPIFHVSETGVATELQFDHVFRLSGLTIAAIKMNMFALGIIDQTTRNESNPARVRHDHNGEWHVLLCLQRFKVFSTDSPIDTLHNIATMDMAAEDIQEYLVNAERLDQKQLNAIFQDIFIFSKDVGVVHRKLYDLLKKTKAPPFASLYVVKKQTRYKEVLADHNTLLRLVVAYDDGRVVDRPRILRH